MQNEIGSLSFPARTDGAVSRRKFLASSCFLAGAAAALPLPRRCAASVGTAAAPFQLRRGAMQNFFDDSMISYQRRLVRRWLPAVVNSKPVLAQDKPWEGDIHLHGSVHKLPDGGY